MKLLHIGVVLLTGLLAAGTSRAADTYKLDVSHSTVAFSISHLVISEVDGRFNEFDGAVKLEGNTLVAAEATIQAKSVDTGNSKRDDHLRNTDFFDVEKFPTITFVSKRVEDGKIIGDFTLHGVTKEVALPYTIKGPIKDPWGKTRIGIKAEATLSRKDYGLTWNKVLEAGGVTVGDEVKIRISAEAVKE